MPYPMPDLVIKKVKAYGKSTALPGVFDFANRNGILFEWNKDVDKFPEEIVDVEDVILYPSLAAEHPGVVLGRNQPLPSIEEELVTQGQAEDAAARNANLQPFDVTGVAAVPIIHTNANKLVYNKIDDDNGIIAMEDIPQQPPHAPLIVNDTEDDNDDYDNANEDEDNDDLSDEDDNDESAAATDAQEGNKSDSDQGVQRLQRRRKGTSKKHADYSMLMAARRARRGGQRRALICNGCVFFSSDKISEMQSNSQGGHFFHAGRV